MISSSIYYKASKLKSNCFSLVNSFSTAHVIFKEQLNSAKRFKPSSQQWLQRQLNDSYVKRAKIEHYRCRSAFKLLEIDKSYKILRPGQTVVDLGCAPGSWTQVVVKATQASDSKSKSLVIGIDLSSVHPIEGATLLSALDFTKESSQQRLTEALLSRKVDVVLSDMAPAASGIKSVDHSNIIKLCYAALRFAEKNSKSSGTLVMKLFDGGETQVLKRDAQSLYERVKIVRPEASRKDSSEIYFVCLNFKGIQGS